MEIKKPCTECGDLKELECFPKQKAGKYGRESQCKDCKTQRYQNNRERILKQQAQYKQNHKKEVAQYLQNMRNKLQPLLEKQNGLCKMCTCHISIIRGPRNNKTANEDHMDIKLIDGASMRVVRGLLCSGCNTWLGLHGDDYDGVKNLNFPAAIEYLLPFKEYSCVKKGNKKYFVQKPKKLSKVKIQTTQYQTPLFATM